ncbi:MAG: P1 family peptidase [Marinicaulis sp.]|nr:P1 family peptidase [Marinicaulis sp.]NNE40090.1 P1 family peptidase [Marinicaulis sp.]NNL88423.1 P1 family peptidase [Marinicaulis sp.]
MPQPGPHNLITDVAGITVGNATDEKVQTGVTVLRCTNAFITSADVRGGAPGVRETETLAPENLVGRADAIVLTGGSVFGLAAADGVTNALSSNDVGLRLGDKGPAIPIVPAAVLHDLSNDGDKGWGDEPPYADLGKIAVNVAAEKFDLGNVGAGRGAKAGSVKGGLGSASIILESGVTVGALVAANPVGSVFFPDGKSFYAAPWELNDEFGGLKPTDASDDPSPFPPYSRFGIAQAGANTTIAIVATDAALTKVENKRVAMMAHDGIARAVRPTHTPFDGDIVFSVSTEKIKIGDDERLRSMSVAMIGAAAADCLTRAIARAVYEAAC